MQSTLTLRKETSCRRHNARELVPEAYRRVVVGPPILGGSTKDSEIRCNYKDIHREDAPVQHVTESVERLVVDPVIRAAPWDAERLRSQEQKPQACLLLISESDVSRSVLAAASLRVMLQDAGLEGQVELATCGTRPYNLGEGPEPAVVAAAEAMGLELPAQHAARLFDPANDIVSYDLLLVMDKFTAGDVMREVSSFELINRTAQFSYKVRRLGEFLPAPEAQEPPAVMQYSTAGDEMDIEDPLYGNVGGEEEEPRSSTAMNLYYWCCKLPVNCQPPTAGREEQQAVMRTARKIWKSCRGLVGLLLELGAVEASEVAGEREQSPCRPPLGPALRSRSGSEQPAGVLKEGWLERGAVIGAGAAGLAAARELRDEGHDVTVLEQSPYVGGVWRYDPRTETGDLLGANPDRSRVHSSMYEKLRTNLPRELMSFVDFPFDAAFLGPRYSSDPRRFCGHAEVLGYLDAFADYFELRALVRTRTRVLSVQLAEEAAAEGAAAAAAAAGPEDRCQHLKQQQQEAAGKAATEPLSPRFGFVVTSEWLGPDGGSNIAEHAAAATASPSRDRSQGHGDGQEAVSNDRDGGEKPQAARLRNQQQQELYDAVVVCNGHYSEPRLPQVRGMYGSGGSSPCDRGFPGEQLHSHNYRSAEKLRGKVVLVVGASNSGEDISRELSAGGAARVLLSAWSWKNEAWAADTAPYGPGSNIYRFPMVSELHADGSATFTDGRREGPIDAVIYCTGYRYSFPFLRGSAAAAARVEDNCVGPLWLHMLPPGPLAPGLSFIGLPWKVVPFPQFQMQSKLIARLLSGRVPLPSHDQMEADIAVHFEAMRAQQLPKRYTHMQGQQQFKYNDLLARCCGPDVEPLPWWRAELNRIVGMQRRERPDDYRDAELADAGSEAAAALSAAYADFAVQVGRLTGLHGASLSASAAALEVKQAGTGTVVAWREECRRAGAALCGRWPLPQALKSSAQLWTPHLTFSCGGRRG
ncbi:hypothetical protein VOLCADRAFT_106057 [Volvox carteri f. nagariensis]|uniref:Flavin-containing monooxygenase n=1 Tax=Volvox carteri f. nagariensis TaxID=3068 RepID=D8U4T5_VOLCA|nr:uncharacterized protein VOLCADRAFT_106057 [Volvox carteri f. nagariensis]EFJ45244.1 hypothetical protein VOLCADRAFT_106057 [Volvox carteri f. nagariensis]|eukprot:XP_002953620.1 hypothetical protein VOLCADRAFT_106057 [Volvox carteri f. nagariensis]